MCGSSATASVQVWSAAMNSEVSEAKRNLPLPALMNQLGLGEHAKKSARCPFHDDRHNSFSVWQKDGRWSWKCHAGCGQGDEINFVAKHLSLSNGDASKRYLEMAGVIGSSVAALRVKLKTH